MGAAAARGIIIILRLCSAVNGVVKEQNAAIGNIKAALFKVAVCCLLKAHGFKLAFHNSNRNPRYYKT